MPSFEVFSGYFSFSLVAFPTVWILINLIDTLPLWEGLALDQAPQWGKKDKKRGQIGHIGERSEAPRGSLRSPILFLAHADFFSPLPPNTDQPWSQAK